MILIPKCFERKCKWFFGVTQPDNTELSEVVTCLAFPEGIPEDIAFGDNKHEKVQEGQVGSFIYET